jgi:hypothetical protein
MPVWVSKEAPGSTATPEIELHVVFPGEANSTQRLNAGVTGLPVTVAYVRSLPALPPEILQIVD